MLTRARPKQASGGFFFELSAFLTSLADILFHNFLPLALRLQNELDRIAQCAIATGVSRDVVRLQLHFGAGIFHGDGEAASAHRRQIDDVIAEEGSFFEFNSRFFDNFFEGCAFVLDSLTHVFDFKIAGAKRDRF